MMRQWLRGLTIALFCLGEGELLAADKIRVAVANFNVSFMMTGVADKKGFFRDEGLEPEIIANAPAGVDYGVGERRYRLYDGVWLGGAGGGARLAGARRR